MVACSDRKHSIPPDELKLRSIAGSLAERSGEWQRRLASVATERRPAHALYAGGHWYWTLKAFERARSYSTRAELWVMSAGYGLIRADESIKPYSATFSRVSPDSVWRNSDDGEWPTPLMSWWQTLPHHARLADLVASGRDSAVVLVAGASYLLAASGDLNDAVTADATGERLSIISAGAPKLASHLSVDARFRSLVGGTNSSLNARLVAWLADAAPSHDFRRSRLEELVHSMGRHLPPVDQPKRARQTDAEIATWLQSLLASGESLSRSQALQQFRRSGFACEQTRFKSLWETALRH